MTSSPANFTDRIVGSQTLIELESCLTKASVSCEPWYGRKVFSSEYAGSVELGQLSDKVKELCRNRTCFQEEEGQALINLKEKITMWYADTDGVLKNESYISKFLDWTTYGHGLFRCGARDRWSLEDPEQGNHYSKEDPVPEPPNSRVQIPVAYALYAKLFIEDSNNPDSNPEFLAPSFFFSEDSAGNNGDKLV